MKPKMLHGVAAAFAVMICANAVGEVLHVTPQTLGDWNVFGLNEKGAVDSSDGFLPAGAQIAKGFKTTGITLSLVVWPFFSTQQANWTVLEVGSAALVFIRTGEQGEMKLVVGGSDPIDLPFRFTIDENGRSAEPVALKLEVDGANVAVGVDGKNVTFPAVALGKQPFEVVFSVGSESDFPIAELDVTLAEKNDADNVTARAVGKNVSDAAVLPRNRKPNGLFSTSASFWSEATNPTQTVGKKSAVPEQARDAIIIFTPPAIRHGRADALRNVVGKSLN